VVISAPFMLVIVGLSVAPAPEAIPLALIPVAILVAALLWLDRIHPQPWSTRIHSLLWGATIVVVVSGLVNSAAEEALGASVAAVVAAPMVEEIMKGLGVLWAVRRGEVDGVMDGILTAGWVALGFTLIEDVTYFALTAQDGGLRDDFILRGLLTPFAHPLLTFWTGLAVGMAVYRRRRLVWAWWGLALAVTMHMMLNGAWEVAGTDLSPLPIALYLAMTIPIVTWLILLRRREANHFIAAVPSLPQYRDLTQPEQSAFESWQAMLAYRRRLPRGERGRFDGLRTCLARLTLQQSRPGGPDPARDQQLIEQLQSLGVG
jgi:protease PrsW